MTDVATGLDRAAVSNGWAALGLGLARSAWVVATVLALGLALFGIPLRFETLLAAADRRSLVGLGLSAETYATYVLALDLLVILIHVSIAAAVVWLRPRHFMCLLVSFALSANGAIIPLSLAYSAGSTVPAGQFLAGIVICLGLVSSVALLYLFPDGQFVPPWTRWLAGLWAALVVAAIFLPHAAVALPRWPLLVQVLVLLAWTGTGVFAQVYRYQHVASPIERQQTKWGFLGIMAAALAPFAYFLPFVILPTLRGPRIPNMLYQQVGAGFFASALLAQLIGSAGFALLRMLFPISFAIAILRYRLWDIDVIIRRTLIYAALTAALALIYLTSVVLLEAVFRALIGHAAQSQLSVVASTLAIAALFGPLRRRVQDAIDRRFFRRKYDAARTLAQFADTARDETDLDRLTARLLSVVDEAMQPTHASLWLRADESAADGRNAPRNDLQTSRP